MAKDWDLTKHRYEIRVKKTLESVWISLYVGPWNKLAESKWSAAWTFYVDRRLVRFVDTKEALAMFDNHGDLVESEKYLDDFYVVPDDGPPNRRVDPEILSALRRKVFPFNEEAA